jgi:ABC-type transport system involved in multi-copper enzyme maturation permease subunit
VIGALDRLEAHAVIRARWFYASLALATGIAGFFLLVAARESSVLGFTGFGRVMGGVVQAALLLLPVLALFATSQSVTSARQAGVMEWYLAQPVSRGAVFRALFLPRLGAVALPTAAVVPLLAAAAAVLGQPVEPSLTLAFITLLAGESFCFSALGLWVGTVSRSPEQALLRALVLWIACALLVDFALLGLLLRWELPAWAIFSLAGLNPMQAGRIGILAVIDAQMGALGPVGTWATVMLGPRWTAALGLGWPVVLGFAAVFLARRAFLRRDAL